MASEEKQAAYWIANRRIVFSLLTVWFIASFGCSILFVDELDRVRVFGTPLGFWMAHQGSMWIFLALVFIYVGLMKRLDRKFDLHED